MPPDTRIVSIFIPGRPATINGERSQHWRDHRLATRDCRMEAMLRLRPEGRIGTMAHVKVDAWPHYATRRSLPDTGACMPTVKAVIDGAVDAGLMLDDGPEVVVYLGFHRPTIDNDLGDGLFMTFEEVEGDSPWLK